jgi:DNA-binding winged helix-turn-helix (wHTH) protein
MNPTSGSVEYSGIYSFGDYALDTKSRTVRSGERVLELTPKQFQTLLVLVENHDRIMSKGELLNSIWPEQFVEESNVNQNICVLRKLLGETNQGKKFIETFPGRGYRFSESVAAVQDSHQVIGAPANASEAALKNISSEAPAKPRPQTPASELAKSALQSYWRYFVTAILCLVVGAIVSAFVYRRTVKTPKEQALTVPPAQLRTLAKMDGALSQPSWCQDGEHIAFVYSSPDGSRSAIYIQSLQDVRPYRVVHGTGKYSSPVWSPDGRLLAYLRIRPNSAKIVILNIASSIETTLASLFPHRYQLNYRHLDWSPDGSFLVVDDKAVESDPLSLYLVSVSNGDKIRLTYPNMDIIGHCCPK